MSNLINGRKPIFGDPEQIAWLKRQRRLREATERGYVVADVEENPLGAKLFKDQLALVRFICPGCLERHQFSLHLVDRAGDYTAPCGVEFWYDGGSERLQLIRPSDEFNA